MKRATVILVSIAALSSIVHAQQKSSEPFSRAVIEIAGTKLHLGMTKAETLEKLAGNQITKLNEDNWIVGNYEHLGPTLQFLSGRLNYADREWTTGYNDTGGALFGAVNSLNAEGFSTCTVSADTHSSPDMIAQRVWIKCGQKTIVLIRHSIGEKTFTSVMEQLGSMRDTTN